ncbi:SiaC family regulatory phosphoprotein [Ekhidna sp.]|uniref:SiaC family regulatory phosphoprotein n=1 Tax=Ekhidna sp. TaxID=2608089 RepID=UPI003C7A1630
MNAQEITQNCQEGTSPLRVVKSDLKVFTVRYLESLNLITAVGWSITDDAWIKYCQMMADIELHLKRNEELKVYFKLELMNTSSAKYLFKVLQRLNEAHASGKDVKIYWSCASADYSREMVETGLDMAGMCDFSFQITEA